MYQQSEIESVARLMADAAIQHIDTMQPRIFLMGPDMGTNDPAADLRRELKQRCESLGLTIVAEHPQVDEAGKEGLGELFDLTRWELRIASDSEVVVIIPASPGSFAELGLFSMRSKICPKMLVLFHTDFENDDSYLQQGPKKAAQTRHAKIVFIDYSDFDEAWAKVSSFIQLAKAKMADDLL